MFEITSTIASTLLIGVGSYHVARHVAKLWTGKSDEEIDDMFHDAVNRAMDDTPPVETEVMVNTENEVHKVLGNKRYREHCALACSDIGTPLISTDSSSGVSVLKVCVFSEDEGEERRIETVVTSVVKKSLGRRGCDTRILADWTKRDDLDIPCLEVRYAKNRKQSKNLTDEIASRRKRIVARNTPVIDDTEDVDLFE